MLNPALNSFESISFAFKTNFNADSFPSVLESAIAASKILFVFESNKDSNKSCVIDSLGFNLFFNVFTNPTTPVVSSRLNTPLAKVNKDLYI